MYINNTIIFVLSGGHRYARMYLFIKRILHDLSDVKHYKFLSTHHFLPHCMKILRITTRIALVLGLFLGIYACSHDMPEPQVSTPQTSALDFTPASKGAIETAQDWFLEASDFNNIHINWDKARTTGNWFVAPLTDTPDPFAKKDKYGYRYLVVDIKNSAEGSGRIVELIVDGQRLDADESVKLALNAVQPVLKGKPTATLNSVTAWVIIYSPAYKYEVGYVYKNGALQEERVELNGQTSRNSSGQIQNKTTLLQYITVTTCGYVNGYLSNCITETYVIDTGSGGGSDGGSGSGGGGGGGSSPGNNWGGVGGIDSPVAEDGPLDVGDHSKIMSYKYDNSTTIKVLIEWTKEPPKIEKISSTVVGLVAATTFVPFGDGTARYFPNKYSNGDDMIRFNTNFQFQAGTGATGPIANGTIFTLSGALNATTGEYRINMVKRP